MSKTSVILPVDRIDWNRPSLTHPRSPSWRQSEGYWSWWGWRSAAAFSPRWSETWACSSSPSPSESEGTASRPHAACLGRKNEATLSHCDFSFTTCFWKLLFYKHPVIWFHFWGTWGGFSFLFFPLLFFFSHHSTTHPGRCWRWTQTPGSLNGSSLTGESALCSASAWTKNNKREIHLMIYLFLSHQWRQRWGLLLRHQGDQAHTFWTDIISDPLPQFPFPSLHF